MNSSTSISVGDIYMYIYIYIYCCSRLYIATTSTSGSSETCEKMCIYIHIFRIDHENHDMKN